VPCSKDHENRDSKEQGWRGVEPEKRNLEIEVGAMTV